MFSLAKGGDMYTVSSGLHYYLAQTSQMYHQKTRRVKLLAEKPLRKLELLECLEYNTAPSEYFVHKERWSLDGG